MKKKEKNNQKQISFVVPCYNSEEYMRHAIDSLLKGKEEVEIIIIDDGSTDCTLKIAKDYEKKYPSIVKVHHQENGGHGEGINQGLKLAKGRYFKVIDSDDWVDEDAYKKLLNKIKDIDSDLIVTNYVYTYNDRPNHVVNYSNVFKENKECTWEDTKKFKTTQYLMLHGLMYKKEVLDKTNIDLPKHTFYEDNLFIYLPLINTKTIYYLNLDFYQYFIGRADQSVQEPQLIKRSSHQVLVTKRVCEAYDLSKIESKKLRKIMERECSLMVTLAVIFSRLSRNDEGEKVVKEIWDFIKEKNPNLYKSLRKKSLGYYASLPGKTGRNIVLNGYKFAHKLVKFN